VYDLGETYEGDVWVSTGTGDCNPLDPGADQVFHHLGPARALADFPAIEEIEE